MALRLMAVALVAMASVWAVSAAQAQSRAPTAAETAAVRACATKNQDDTEKAIQRCVNNLVAGPCIDKFGASGTGNSQMADCYYIEAATWDALLNENYSTLLGTLDAAQTAKARAMQRDWIASRDSTCQFFEDKIQGTMAMPMIAECVTRETARRAMQLKIFNGL
jgi:uncharacterized protein YecT (DUF1311 family)